MLNVYFLQVIFIYPTFHPIHQTSYSSTSNILWVTLTIAKNLLVIKRCSVRSASKFGLSFTRKILHHWTIGTVKISEITLLCMINTFLGFFPFLVEDLINRKWKEVEEGIESVVYLLLLLLRSVHFVWPFQWTQRRTDQLSWLLVLALRQMFQKHPPWKFEMARMRSGSMRWQLGRQFLGAR